MTLILCRRKSSILVLKSTLQLAYAWNTGRRWDIILFENCMNENFDIVLTRAHYPDRYPALLGHTKLIFCFSDPAGLFLADLKKKKKNFFINIPYIMIVAGQEYSLEKALLACY